MSSKTFFCFFSFSKKGLVSFQKILMGIVILFVAIPLFSVLFTSDIFGNSELMSGLPVFFIPLVVIAIIFGLLYLINGK